MTVGSIFSIIACAILSPCLNISINLLYMEIFLSVVEKNHTYLSTIILVDNARPNINKIFPGQSWSRSDSSICIRGNHERKACFNFSFCITWNNHFLDGTKVIPSWALSPLDWHCCFRNKFLHIEFLNRVKMTGRH